MGGFYPVTVNDKPLLLKLKNSLVEASGGVFELEAPATGAEVLISQEIPGFMARVNKPGGSDSTNFGDRSGAAGNHSPYFYVDMEL